MELIEIEAFLTIAETGGFTRAAHALGVSQPAISRRIELLEREVGAPLFERLPGGARLTAPGESFLPFARQAVAALRDGAAAVHAHESGEEGVVHLALVGTLASTGLTDRLRAFRADHPAVRIVLRTARSDEVSNLVQRGDATLGLRYFPDPSIRLVNVPSHDEPLVVVAAATSGLVTTGPSAVAVLTGIPWVGFPIGVGSSGEPFARVLARQLVRAGLEAAEIIVVDSLTAQKRLIEADFGLGLLPASAIEEEVRLGTLRVLPIPDLATSVPIFVVSRREGYLGPAGQRLLSALTEPGTLPG